MLGAGKILVTLLFSMFFLDPQKIFKLIHLSFERSFYFSGTLLFSLALRLWASSSPQPSKIHCVDYLTNDHKYRDFRLNIEPKHSTHALQILEAMPQLSLITYNLGQKRFFPHQRRALQEIQAQLLRKWEPHIIIFQEVFDLGREHQPTSSFHFFEQFHVLRFQGNDKTGIDIAMLTKKDLFLNVEYRTNRQFESFDQTRKRKFRVFSRDLPVLILRVPGNFKPLLIVLGTHYKSKRDRSRDPQSRQLRKEQVLASIQIIRDLQTEFGIQAPILFGGDFNGDVNNDRELEPLKKELNFEDAFNLLPHHIQKTHRGTHTYFTKNKSLAWEQLDFFLLSPSLIPCLKKVLVIRSKSPISENASVNSNVFELNGLISDHFPVYLELDTRCLIELWRS